jgi:hypothetical protein
LCTIAAECFVPPLFSMALMHLTYSVLATAAAVLAQGAEAEL